MSIHHIKELVNNELAAVNDLILKKISAETGLIDDLGNYLVKGGGKRLRPIIVILSSLACNYAGQSHITLGAMVEFFHTATLLHDDVIDDSLLRRGKDTANKIWGSKASILVGDFLFTQYMELMLDVGNINVMRLLCKMANEITRGEIKQLNNKHKYDITLNEYFDVIKSKTSLLFGTSAALGAIISDSGQEIENSLFDFGIKLGNAFQIIDDILDYASSSDIIGKNIGEDLAEGKATLPLIYILKNGNQSQKDLIKNTLKSGDISKLPEILEILNTTNAYTYSMQIAKNEIEIAISLLSILPDSIYKKALIDVAYYAIDRKL